MTDSKETPKSPEDLQKELQDFIKKFGGDVMAFPSSPMAPEAGESPEADKAPEDEVPEAVLDFDMNPTQVKAYLDRFVIGQDEAIRAQDAELEAERLAAESDALIEEDNARAIEAADASCLCDICLA